MRISPRSLVKRFMYRLALSFAFIAIIIFTSGVITPTITYATDSGEEATDSETPVSTTETASSEVIQESDSEAETQSAVEEEEPIAAAMVISSSEEPSPSASVTETVTAGGDDSSYQIPIEVPILFDGVSYSNIYATTNSVITYGTPDGTYWDYPATPSISLLSRDWWARPNFMSDEWFIIRTSQGGFQVDGSYRPYGSNAGETTNIVITAQIQTNGTVSYTYSVVGPLYGGERTGARLHDGTVVPLEEAGISQVEEPTVLEPEPVPEPEPEPEPTPVDPEPETDPSGEESETQGQQESPTSTPAPLLPSVEELPRIQSQPSQQTQPTPAPTQEPPARPTQESSIAPTPQQNLEQVLSNPDSSVQERVEAIISTLEPGEPVTLELLIEAGIDYEDLPPETPIELREDSEGNPVVIDAQTAAALSTFESVDSFLEEITTNPAAVIAALSAVGADMSPEERRESEQVVVSAIVVGNIAHLASNAGAVSAVIAYRRNP